MSPPDVVISIGRLRLPEGAPSRDVLAAYIERRLSVLLGNAPAAAASLPLGAPWAEAVACEIAEQIVVALPERQSSSRTGAEVERPVVTRR